MERKRCKKKGVQTKFLANVDNFICSARIRAKKEKENN
jgi:hypothetical protein